MTDYECPVCHDGDIEEDDCFDTDHGTNEIIEYCCGYCLACGRKFKWERHYKFDHCTEYKED